MTTPDTTVETVEPTPMDYVKQYAGHLFAPGVLEVLDAMLEDPGAEGLGGEYLIWFVLAKLGQQGMNGIKDIAVDQSAGPGFVSDAGVLFKYIGPKKGSTTVVESEVEKRLPAKENPGLYKPHGPSVRKLYPPKEYPGLWQTGNGSDARVEITLPGGMK